MISSKDWFLNQGNTQHEELIIFKNHRISANNMRKSETVSVLSEIEENPFSNAKIRAHVIED